MTEQLLGKHHVALFIWMVWLGVLASEVIDGQTVIWPTASLERHKRALPSQAEKDLILDMHNAMRILQDASDMEHIVSES